MRSDLLKGQFFLQLKFISAFSLRCRCLAQLAGTSPSYLKEISFSVALTPGRRFSQLPRKITCFSTGPNIQSRSKDYSFSSCAGCAKHVFCAYSLIRSQKSLL